MHPLWGMALCPYSRSCREDIFLEAAPGRIHLVTSPRTKKPSPRRRPGQVVLLVVRGRSLAEVFLDGLFYLLMEAAPSVPNFTSKD